MLPPKILIGIKLVQSIYNQGQANREQGLPSSRSRHIDMLLELLVFLVRWSFFVDFWVYFAWTMVCRLIFLVLQAEVVLQTGRILFLRWLISE